MKYVRALSWLLPAIIGALLLVSLAGSARYEVAGVKTEVSVSPNLAGGTELALPPFGELKAKTHSVPLRLGVEVKGINPDRLSQALDKSRTARDYFAQAERDGRAAAGHFLIRLALIAALGGALGALFLTRTWWKLSIASAVGLMTVVTLACGVYLQFNAAAFAQPEFSGSLGSVPLVQTALTKRSNPLDILKEDVRLAAKNLGDFASKVDNWQPLTPDQHTVRVLAVSDIHNNPATFSLLTRIIKDFRVDVVIDTGDVTDFGTPLEANLFTQISRLERPYLYVPGNHDTSEVATILRTTPGVTVLDDREVEQNGMTVYGLADPLAGIPQVDPISDNEMDRRARQLEKRFADLNPKPLIVAVHDPRMAEYLYGKVPIILAGHTHEARISRKGKTTYINAGSSGASGLGLLQDRNPGRQRYTVSLLYIDAAAKQLVAVDSMEITGLSGEFVLRRTLIDGVEQKH